MQNENISTADYDAFRLFLKEACGIVLGDNKHYLINSRLKNFLEKTGIGSIRNLIEKINSGSGPALKGVIIDAMTTNETYWFRDSQPFEMLKDKIFPELIHERGKPLVRVWSAACSSGQEPYSISIIASEFFSGRLRVPINIDITATDISPSILAKAKEGVYDELMLSRGLSPERRERYFIPNGSHWVVQDKIRNRVKFHEFNLMKEYTLLGKFSIIFCRNVLIYFSPELKKNVLDRLANALEPGGYLLLGGSESMAAYSDRFETVRYNNVLAFRLK